MKSFLVGWLTVLLLLLTGVHFAEADFDPPSNPPIQVDVTLKKITLQQDQDDGIDGNAEVVIGFTVAHTNHDNNAGSITIDDFNWDAGSSRDLNIAIYSHVECTKFTGVILTIQVVEDDSDIFATVTLTVVAVIAGIVATVASTGTAVVAAVVGGGSVLGALGFQLNSSEDLGQGSDSTTTAGTRTLKTRGSGGGTDIEYEVKLTTLSESNDCAGQPVRTASVIPDSSMRLEEGSAQFATLRETIGQASTITVEAGNPRGLTTTQMAGLQTEFPRALLQTLVDPWMTLIVKLGTDVGGENLVALDAIEDARDAISAGDFLGAVDLYEQAWSVSLGRIFSSGVIGGPSSVTIDVVDSLTGELPNNVVVEVLQGSVPVFSTVSSGGSAETILAPGTYSVSVKTRVFGFPINLASQQFSVVGPTHLTVTVSALFIPVNLIPNAAFAAVSLIPGLVVNSFSKRLLRKRGFRRGGVIGALLGAATFAASYAAFTLL